MAEIVSQLRRQVDKWFALACPAGLRFRHAPVPVPVPAFPCGLVFRSRRSPFLPWPLQVARCSRLFRTSRHRLPFKRKRPQRKQQWPKQRLPRPVPKPATGRAFPKLYRKPSRKPRSRRRTRLLILRPNRMTRQPKPRTQARPILQSPKQRRPYRRPRQKIQAKWQAKWPALRRPGRANRQRKSCRKQATLRWQHRRRLHLRRLHRRRRRTGAVIAGRNFGPDAASRLGEADFTRTEGEVETWQYRFETCVVDYFLVVDSDTAKIVSWAWRAPVIGAQVDETACRRALADRDAAS